MAEIVLGGLSPEHPFSVMIEARPERWREPQAPFPQADDLRKVIGLVFHLYRNPTQNTPEHLTEVLGGVVGRQVSYYTDAAIWLGLVRRYSVDRWSITKAGRTWCESSDEDKMRVLTDAVLGGEAFHAAARSYLEGGLKHDEGRILALVGGEGGINRTTARRRALTVRSWIETLYTSSPGGDLFAA